MIRGMSYYRGIFFMNNKGLSHATLKDGKVVTRYYEFSLRAFLFLLSRLIFSIPLYFLLLGITLLLLIERPDLIFINISFLNQIPEIPLFTYIVFLFSYHFMFPLQLKKYHGAEHKVFSYMGRRHLANAEKIKMADIVNRYCSTNSIVLFFCFFFLCIPFVNGWFATLAGFLAIVIIPRFWTWGDRKIFFPLSAFLQKNITTATPDEQHIKVAILSYMSLQAEQALNEVEVWQQYEFELEKQRIEKAKQKHKEDLIRINRLIEDEERKQILYDHYRDSLLIGYIENMESNHHHSSNEEINDAV